MGISTDGQLSFGITCEEGEEFPWDDDKYEGEIEGWWRDINGFNKTNQVWDEEGNRRPGVTDNDLDQYFVEQHAWDKENPCPANMVNVCHCDYPMWMLVVPGTYTRASRGCPIKVDPAAMTVPEEKFRAFTDFIEKHMPKYEYKEPRWYLSSYWG
jgi:hypothetical protein